MCRSELFAGVFPNPKYWGSTVVLAVVLAEENISAKKKKNSPLLKSRIIGVMLAPFLTDPITTWTRLAE